MKVGLMVGEGSGALPELKGLIERGQMAERLGLECVRPINEYISTVDLYRGLPLSLQQRG